MLGEHSSHCSVGNRREAKQHVKRVGKKDTREHCAGGGRPGAVRIRQPRVHRDQSHLRSEANQHEDKGNPDGIRLELVSDFDVRGPRRIVVWTERSRGGGVEDDDADQAHR